MKLLIISGSQRSHSQSAKVAEFIKTRSQDFEQVEHLELIRYRLPFWSGEQDSKYAEDSDWHELELKIRQADALALITPEWHGMATPLLKNFLLMCNLQDTAHKPVLLASVVSGISGAYPIAELRMNALKNIKLVAIPDHLILRDATNILNPDIELTPLEQQLRERIDYSLHMLYLYAQALTEVRRQHSSYPNQQEYCFGM
ncbi:NADPH-dependent FMN reductase [Dongshaea marina]|uniref:NADPH-dependent FMN reductase n=1 Tax=Dongshaea marina TaxID=2047966 RepID=UPI000D3E7078|nr:NAD(P)H-dependent oxidoreductase [Dongshaea marina]